MLRFWPDFFHFVRIDQPRIKIHYNFGVKGQERVTRGQNVNFHSKCYSSERKRLTIVRIGQNIPLIHVHMGSEGIKIKRSIGVTRGHNVNFYLFHSQNATSPRENEWWLSELVKSLLCSVYIWGLKGLKLKGQLGSLGVIEYYRGKT